MYTSNVLWGMGKITCQKKLLHGARHTIRVLQLLVESEYELNLKLDISSPQKSTIRGF